MPTWKSLNQLVVLPFLITLACGGDGRQDMPETTTELPPATADNGPPPMVNQTVEDASVDAIAPRIDCLTPGSGITCDDGRFCNGAELCDPSNASADARGCVLGTPVACDNYTQCSERMRTCWACNEFARNDADGDGHEAASCGGDDCRDDDPTIHPLAAEVCNGRDDDCDTIIDGAPADGACMAVAPAMSTSMCVNAGCQISCSDPDADLVMNACVKHDDCVNVTRCGAGTCVDGVRSFSCMCPAGYSGTGTTSCADVDECAGMNDCDDSPKSCVNTEGSYRCECPDTHFGDGKGEHGCTRKAVKVAAGIGSTCAILVGGSVKCWGDNAFGQLGVDGVTLGSAKGQMGDDLPAVPLQRAAASIAVGSDLACAVLSDGAAKCWGYNGYGTLGAGAPNGFATNDAPLPRAAKEVRAGSGNGFALLDDGTIGRWGSTFSPWMLSPASAFDRGSDYRIYHLCALFDGTVSCWPGYDYFGETDAVGTLGPNYPGVPNVIDLGADATQIELGNQHSCALLQNGTVKCWGRNDAGQLGVGDTVHRGVMAAQMGDALPAVALNSTAKTIAVGPGHACALLLNGGVKCWGQNESGQLGLGSTDTKGDAPGELGALVDLGTGRSAVAIDVGAHSCALLDNGGVKCWGPNAHGELGQGDVLARGATQGSMGDALREIDVGE